MDKAPLSKYFTKKDSSNAFKAYVYIFHDTKCGYSFECLKSAFMLRTIYSTFIPQKQIVTFESTYKNYQTMINSIKERNISNECYFIHYIGRGDSNNGYRIIADDYEVKIVDLIDDCLKRYILVLDLCNLILPRNNLALVDNERSSYCNYGNYPIIEYLISSMIDMDARMILASPYKNFCMEKQKTLFTSAYEILLASHRSNLESLPSSLAEIHKILLTRALSTEYSLNENI